MSGKAATRSGLPNLGQELGFLTCLVFYCRDFGSDIRCACLIRFCDLIVTYSIK